LGKSARTTKHKQFDRSPLRYGIFAEPQSSNILIGLVIFFDPCRLLARERVSRPEYDLPAGSVLPFRGSDSEKRKAIQAISQPMQPFSTMRNGISLESPFFDQFKERTLWHGR
jgi:hypothetical protein